MNERQRRFWGFLAVTLITALLYFMTTAPTVVFWDVGEFLASSHTLAVPHPPGTPLYVILGRLMVILPLPLAPLYTLLTGVHPINGVLKITMISLLSGAFSAGLLYLIALDVMDRWSGMEDLPWHVRHLSAAFGALIGMLARTVWMNSIEAETYTPTFFSVVLATWLGFRYWEHKDRPRGLAYLILIPYVFLLSSGIHLSVLPFLPAFFVLLFLIQRDLLLSLDFVAVVALGLLFLTSMLLPYEATPVTYAVHLGSLAALFSLLPLRREDPWGKPWTYVMAAGAVLSLLGRHSVLATLGGYVLLLAGYYGVTRFWKDWKGLAFLLVLVGFLPQFFLIARAHYLHFHPNATRINEADPWTWTAFMDVLTRKQYGPTEFFPRRISVVDQFRVLGLYLSWQYAGLLLAPFLILAIYGVLEAYYRDRKGFWYVFSLLFIASVGMLFLLNLKDSPTHPVNPLNARLGKTEVRDRDYFYAYFYSFLGLFMALGFAGLLRLGLETLKRSRTLVYVLGYPLMGVLLFAHIALTYPLVNRNHNFIAEDYAHNLMMSVTTDKPAVLFTNGDNDTFPLWFLQEALGFRKNILIANLSLLNTNWYCRQLKAWGAPISFSDQELDSLPPAMMLGRKIVMLRDLVIRDMIATSTGYRDSLKPEDFVPIRNVPVPRIYLAPPDSFRKEVVEGRTLRFPLFFSITTSPEAYRGLQDFFVMEGMVFRLTTRKQEEVVSPPYRLEAVNAPRTHFFLHGSMDPDTYLEKYAETLPPDTAMWRYRGVFNKRVHKDDTHMKLVANYANVAIRLAFYHAAREEYAQALPMLELARKFYSETSDSLPARYLQQIAVMDREIGRMALQAGNYEKAKEALERALTQTNSPDLYYFLGEAYLQSGDSARALSYYEQAYRAMPGEFPVVKRLATLYAARGETARARSTLQNWLNQPGKSPFFEEEARKMIQQLSSEGEE